MYCQLQRGRYMLKNIKKLILSFKYAFSGIAICIKDEISFRIHIIFMLYSIVIAYMLELDRTKFAILFLTIGVVISAEAFNTSIEAVVNLVCPQKHPLAKAAKDSAAGAVLIAAIASVIVGIFLFWQPDKLLEIIYMIFSNVFYSTIFISSVIISALFVFGYKN